MGVFVITVTPFREDGALDLESTDRVVDFYLEKGADGLTVLGVMGEAPKLTAEESRTLRQARARARRATAFRSSSACPRPASRRCAS